MNRIICTKHVENNDEYLFGCSLKNINLEMNVKNYDNNQKYYKINHEQHEGYKNKFENFRKKIEKFSCDFPIKPIFYS